VIEKREHGHWLHPKDEFLCVRLGIAKTGTGKILGKEAELGFESNC